MSFCIRHKQLSINGNFIIRGYSHSMVAGGLEEMS